MDDAVETNGLWRLDGLVEECQRVIDRIGMGEGDSRRVRWDPNPRLLRYYTTLGLLDRAERMVGRTAYYGPKHVAQLLSVKKLQQEGQSLHEIQAVLLGKSYAELCDLLGIVPETVQGREATPSPRAAGRFWERARELPEVKMPLPFQAVVEIKLGHGARLTLSDESFRQLDPDELRAALAPLQKLLEKEEGTLS